MTPEMERALRLNPRLRKRLRERQAELLAAVEAGDPEAVLAAATAWAEAENVAAKDVSAKTAAPPMHRVSFPVEEAQYVDFCKTGVEHDLSPSEVARRYCRAGFTFSSVIWETVRRGGTVADLVKVSGRGPNLAQLALPDFSR
jgi:hypothetical protein